VFCLAAAAPRSGDAALPEVAEGLKAKEALGPGVHGRSRVALEIVTRTLRARWFLAAGANLVAVARKGKGKGKGKGNDKGKGKGKVKPGKRKAKTVLSPGAHGRSRVALAIVTRALCSHCSSLQVRICS
jgi:hypothetical protein